MRVGLLGPVVVEDGSTSTDVRGSRQQGLLALLALHAGTVIANERIVDELWGDDAPANPANALQAVVSRVRKLVGAGTLAARGTGYVLDVAPEAVDAIRFERLLVEARTQVDEGDPAGASATAEAALGLWRGPVLEGLGDLPFARAATARLTELRGAALDTWADAQLALGHHDTLIADLRDAVEQDPLREGTWSRLMLALYRAGRQADALRAYQDARTALADQLGVEPGPELRAMEARVLAQSDDLTGPARAATVPLPRELRRTRTSFVGRDDDLEQVDRALTAGPLVTLVGPGGAGKTRLATELAARRAEAGERVVFVDLSPVTADDVTEAIVAALGARDQPAGPDPLDALERVTLQFLTGPALVVVDNCEHVVDDAARAVEALVGASPNVRVLATSREGLGVPGEQLHPLLSLGDDVCMRLFVDRAGAVRPGFDPSPDEQRAIAEICRNLDGLPLAIELAAARVRALPVAEIARRLDDRFRLLTGGARTAQPRQQTLRAVVEWSHDLLDEEEKHVLARLSTFVGGFTLDDAAEVVGGDKVDVADVGAIVLRLVDKSLVTTDPEHGRFGLLQTLGLHAREQLQAAGDEALLRERHARHFATVAERLEPDVRGPAQRRALDQLEREHDNLAAALEWAVETGDKELGARLVAALGWFWYVHSHVAEGARWGTAVCALPGELHPVLEARLVRYVGLLGLFAGVEEVPPVQHAVELLRGADEPGELAETLIVVAAAYPRHGDTALTAAALEEATALGRRLGDHWIQGTAGMLSGGMLGGVDEQAKVDASTESVEHFRACGDDWGLSMSLMTRALSLEAMGHYDAALTDYTDAHLAAERLGGAELSQHFEVHRGNLCTLTGDVDTARRAHERAIAAARRGGYTGVLGMALNGLGLACRRLGDLDAAAAAHGEAEDLYLSGRWLAGAALARSGLGFVAELAGDADTAEAHHLASLELARQHDDERAIALACEGLAGVAALRGDHEGAARLLGHAAARRTGAGAPLPAGERADVDRIESSVVGSIGRQRYEALAAEGATAALGDLLPR